MMQLRGQMIAPTNVKQKRGSKEITLFQAKPTIRDLVVFTRQFATMIDAGLPLVQCLEIQSEQQENKSFRAMLSKVKGSEPPCGLSRESRQTAAPGQRRDGLSHQRHDRRDRRCDPAPGEGDPGL
jgi:hypothetical protein